MRLVELALALLDLLRPVPDLTQMSGTRRFLAVGSVSTALFRLDECLLLRLSVTVFYRHVLQVPMA